MPRILAGLVVAASLSLPPCGAMSYAASGTHKVVANDSTRSGFLLQTADGKNNIFLPLDVVAGVEGVSSATLQQDLQAGQTLLQVAGTKYSSAADLATALLANLKRKLDMAATSGKFSASDAAAQYTAILNATETLVTTRNPKIVTEQGKIGAGKQPGMQVNLKLDLINAVAASCNTTTDALQTLLSAGSTTILAACKTTNPSATVDSLSAAVLTAVKSQIDAQVAAGQVTAAEETQMLAKLQAGLPSMLTTPVNQGGDSTVKKG
jgi:hypothetical protein